MENKPRLLVLEQKKEPPDEDLVKSLEGLLRSAKDGNILSISIAVEGQDHVTWATFGDQVSTPDHIYCLEWLKKELLEKD